MKFTVLVLLVSLLSSFVAVGEEFDIARGVESLRASLEEFAALPVSDVIDDEDTNTVSFADECDMAFRGYIASAGCTTNQAVECLMILATNLICSTHSNGFLQACTTEVSLRCLERYGNAEQIQVLEPLLLSCDRSDAWLLSRCIVNFKGLGHSAFASYGQLIDGNIPEMNAIRLLGTIGSKIRFGVGPRPSAAVTNRYTWLSLRDIGKHPWGAVCNTALFECWPAYLTSSNRLVALNMCLEQGEMSPSSTNEVLRIRNQLLALPPGTMQMLPTNQFYNVED